MLKIPLPAMLILAVLLSSGCGPSEGKKEEAGPPVAERLEKAKQLLEEARTAGADKVDAQDFEGQAKKLEDAEKLIDDGKPERARSKIKSAVGGLNDLVQKAEALKKEREAALAVKKKAEKAVADAIKNKADVGNKEAFDEIRGLLAQTQADLDGSNLAKVSSASKNYQRVQELVLRAVQESGEGKRWKVKADNEKKACLEMEGKAKEAKAPELVLQDFNQAQGYFRDAEEEYKQDRFQQAYEGYRSAQNAYIGAISQAKAISEAMVDVNRPAEPAPAANVADAKKPAPVVNSGPDSQEPVGEPEKAAPGELSAEDEIFLSENWQKLCNRGTPSYDPGSGIFEVDYAFGDILRRDIIYPRGPIPEKHIYWKDIIDNIDSKKAEGKKELGISFSANTSGFFCFPFPFKDSVELEYRVQIGTMRNDGSMTTLVMVSPNGKDYLGANFGTIEQWQDGKPVGKKFLPTDPKMQRSPNYWFSKIKMGGVLMKLTLEPHQDGKRSVMKIWYDMDEEPDQPITMATVPARSGYVGFNWFMTKFNIRELKIKGKLDKEAAVKVLRAKLKANPPGGNLAGPGGGSGGPAPKAPVKGKTGKEKAADEEEADSGAASSGTKKTADAKGKGDY
jgi:hypothetical protein